MVVFMDVLYGVGGQSAVIPGKAENVRNVNGSFHGCDIWGCVNWQ